MTREDQQALALARWLDAVERGDGGIDPPPDVDPDVLAAIFAVRPELAPAPRVALDDILAEVREGPFATREEPGGAEVVPFPVPAVRPAEPTPSPRRWQGGLLGLVAAAAATILVVGSLEGDAPTAGSGAMKEVATSFSEQLRRPSPPPPNEAPAREAPGEAVASTPALATAPADVSAADAVVLADDPVEAHELGKTGRVEPIGDRDRALAKSETQVPARAVGPERRDERDQREDDAVTDAEEASLAPLAQTALPEPVERLQLHEPAPTHLGGAVARKTTRSTAGAPPPAAAAPAARTVAPTAAEGAWADEAEAAPAREQVAPDPVAEVRIAVERAAEVARRDPLGAARRVAPHIVPPSDAGLLAAEAAARWALEGGDPVAAAAWARRGLGLPGGAPEIRARVEAHLRAAEETTRE